MNIRATRAPFLTMCGDTLRNQQCRLLDRHVSLQVRLWSRAVALTSSTAPSMENATHIYIPTMPAWPCMESCVCNCLSLCHLVGAIVLTHASFLLPFCTHPSQPHPHPHNQHQTAASVAVAAAAAAASGIPRRVRKRRDEADQSCLSCSATETPEWRKGPTGPRTLCNACGLLFAKQVSALGARIVITTKVGNAFGFDL